ncbi:tail completion protein gp17 [Paracidovorax cattleyae]|uniref:tail completion protein gp17 n=1 Tax=Paracidovorax cattleyae TaxID=80868 RepID=UPI0018AF8CD9|nr:DUF3168 domain-containing protein [Paracidovorax cattleyae]MBF9263934.1 DUF3168 domain-containing protein [Paracidovorax cattleyae]UYL85484.1 hypothetical protein gp29 [Acidovorax phage Aval]
MSLEEDLFAVLLTQCPRVFPVTAPYDTPTPYVVWQHVGGEPIRFLDKTAPSTRQADIQITAWASTPKGALDVLRGIEDALCASTALQASPRAEPVAAYDEGDELTGALQTFGVWGERA